VVRRISMSTGTWPGVKFAGLIMACTLTPSAPSTKLLERRHLTIGEGLVV
jgi:hypothetical protein